MMQMVEISQRILYNVIVYVTQDVQHIFLSCVIIIVVYLILPVIMSSVFNFAIIIIAQFIVLSTALINKFL